MARKNYGSAEIVVQVPFHDVDVMEVAWHGHYCKYFELARCELLNKIGYNYPEMRESGYAWPVIDMSLRFVRPAKFQQKIRVVATIVEYEHRLRIEYVIYDQLTGDKMTKGHTDMVAVDMQTKEMQLVSPEILLQKLNLES